MKSQRRELTREPALKGVKGRWSEGGSATRSVRRQTRNPLVADALKRVYRRSTDFPVEYGKRLDPATLGGGASAAAPLLGLERDVGIQPGCAQRGDENRASRRRDKYDDRRRVRRRIGRANADQHRCKAPSQQQRPNHTEHEPDGDHLGPGGEDECQQLSSLCPKSGAYGELACPLRDSERQYAVDPECSQGQRQRREAGEEGQYERANGEGVAQAVIEGSQVHRDRGIDRARGGLHRVKESRRTPVSSNDDGHEVRPRRHLPE